MKIFLDLEKPTGEEAGAVARLTVPSPPELRS